MDLQNILNTRFALRKLLANESYHLSDVSVPKAALTPEKEPALRPKLAAIAKQIVDCSNSLLLDVYEKDERAKDWISLVNKKVIEDGDVIEIDTRTRPGHKILDHHMTHFYDVKNYKGVSVRSLMTQELLERRSSRISLCTQRPTSQKFAG